MYYEVEVVSDGNSPMDLNRIFSLLSEPEPVTQIVTSDLMGEDSWCDVVGWSECGQCQAYAVEAEDSGEGVILLVYGGTWGIRLRPSTLQADWDLESPEQWGEPCLMLGRDTPKK